MAMSGAAQGPACVSLRARRPVRRRAPWSPPMSRSKVSWSGTSNTPAESASLRFLASRPVTPRATGRCPEMIADGSSRSMLREQPAEGPRVGGREPRRVDRRPLQHPLAERLVVDGRRVRLGRRQQRAEGVGAEQDPRLRVEEAGGLRRVVIGRLERHELAVAEVEFLARPDQLHPRGVVAEQSHLGHAEEVGDHLGLRREFQHRREVAEVVGVHVAHPDVAEVGGVDGAPERREEWLAERGGAGIDEDGHGGLDDEGVDVKQAEVAHGHDRRQGSGIGSDGGGVEGWGIHGDLQCPAVPGSN